MPSAANAPGTTSRPIATTRQRGPGSRPSGKSSSTNAAGTYSSIQLPDDRPTSTPDTGRTPGWAATAAP